MVKTKNELNQYVLTSGKGKILTNGEIYTLIYISKEDINEADWTEVALSEVHPVEDEATDTDYQNALREMGVKV